MNSCILMADIIQEPQLRYTSDNLEIAEMLVQFPGMRENDPPGTLKVIGWGKLAKELQENYHQGDRVILEGRLGMRTIERREGFKEKKAELTVQRIHGLGAGVGDYIPSPAASTPSIPTTGNTPNTSSPLPIPTPMTNNVGTATQPAPQKDWNQPIPTSTNVEPSPAPFVPQDEPDIDDIPF
ncbi:single-stranded DNA-binding protein [Calothrix rhizosoleniae]|uniref:single-stranded DNA-binding protein n=1 Tax=Calothrix rhizosoleniae TaxID=888997 RepID=UPI000B4977EC|nr:single-stranded DNA-binding protein [Calothrix rhizosoleniae]